MLVYVALNKSFVLWMYCLGNFFQVKLNLDNYILTYHRYFPEILSDVYYDLLRL
jgi:hypothetical protein